jgi:broad specificity phosphatase PhoE
MIRIILIRHGHTAWNIGPGQGERFRGTIDLPLADEGKMQARTTAQRLAEIPLTAIYASPLQRAAHTAQIIAEPHGLTVQTLSGLGSMNYGEWAGQSHADVARHWPELYRQWRHDPFSIQIPSGESTTDLRDRAVATLRTILAQHADGDTIALVSHQVVTRTLVCALADLPNTAYWQVQQDLCNLSRFDYDPSRDEFVLVGLNDVCHSAPGHTAPDSLTSALPQADSSGARIVLIRHGQTAWNAGAGEERFRGRTDLPLDPTGQAQARAVANRLRSEPIVALYASPLLRTCQTAIPLANSLKLPVQPHDGLIDINYGHFQGLTHSEAATANPTQYARWHVTPSQVRFPGGESLADVQARLLAILDEVASRHRGESIALFGHQIVNKVAACTLLGLNLDQIWRIQQDTCGLDVFQQVGKGWCTLCLNDVCHLSGVE